MTFRNGKKEIVQSIRTKNGLSPKYRGEEPVQSVQLNIY